MPNEAKSGRIFLVRHGEAQHHIKGFTGGWTDLPLTARGEKQIESLAARLYRELGDKAPDILAGDLIRTKASADIISGKLGVPVTEAPFLREKNNGAAAGKTEEQAAQLRLPRQAAEPDNRNYPGGETRREFYERVAAGMKAVKFSDRPLIIVSHKGTMQNILFWWLGLSIDEVISRDISFDFRPAGLSLLRINKWREREAAFLNDCGHLGAL